MEDKMLLVKKYGLKHEDNAWYSEKENSHKHLRSEERRVGKECRL